MFPNIFLPLKRILEDLIVVNIDKKEREFKSLSQEDIIWYSKDINNKSPRKVDIKSSNIKKVIPITDVYEKTFKNNGYFTSKNFEQILFEILIHLNLVLAKILKNNGDDTKWKNKNYKKEYKDLMNICYLILIKIINVKYFK